MSNLFFAITFILCSIQLSANTFYIDPNNGNIENDGTKESPWNTLQDVISKNKIESYHYLPLPYSNDSKLKIFNKNAPIKAGDTLFLLPGQHGDILLRGYFNTKPITIIAQNEAIATLKQLKISACTNWNIVGLTINPSYYQNSPVGSLVHIESHGWHGPCTSINLSNCKISSGFLPWVTAEEWIENARNGIRVLADSVYLEKNELTNVRHGITISGDHNQVINNQVINFSGDGSRILGSYNLFEGNTIKNCYKVDENHDDGLQSFTTGNKKVDYNIIRNNIILNYEDPNQPLLGSLQGMGFFDGPYRNWIIENNLIVVDHWHGITFLGGYDCQITNNTVLDPTPDITPGPSWIMIDDQKNGEPSSGCTIQNNVTQKITANGLVENNQILLTISDFKENFVDIESFNFHLLESSILVDKADPLSATAYDIEGKARTFGNAPDIGAYEFIKPVTAENVNLPAINIYPNPNSDILHIEGMMKEYRLTIYNISGMQKMQVNISEQKLEIPFSKFANGLYFLEFFNETDGTFFMQKVIKTD